MVGGQKKTGQGRMDAAIDHFAQMGYNKADVRKVVNNLIKNVYGDKGWPFLEESGYLVVQEALFEKQEQEEKLQLQLLQEEQQVEAQQQEGAMMGAPPESDMPIVKVHNEVPSETVFAVEQTEQLVPMIIDPPAPKAALPHPPATGSGRTRLPCYGWISESESDSDYEEFLASRQQQVHVPTSGRDLPKRKRPSRWDVK
ncbi:uncharacterized protein [Lolium perenne]|uniref:uncharacterized protein isoform X1 n=1 Tax=Lolium perenne TaxID=4522 RepID=UPI0021EAC269|nr:uncharacterized protein LOC127321427 isoform X1 [Lolium perenne]